MKTSNSIKNILLPSFLIATMLIMLGCNSQQKQVENVTDNLITEQQKQELMKEKEEFKTMLQKQIEQAEREIKKIDDEMTKAGNEIEEDLKSTYMATRSKWETMKNDMSQRLEEVEQASESTWKETKGTMDSWWKETSKDLKDLKESAGDVVTYDGKSNS